MNFEDPILQFLSQPDNLKVAIDVSRQLEKVRDRYHSAFWPALYKKLSKKLEHSTHHEKWRISKPSNHHLDSWVQIHIEPQTSKRHLPFMEICFEQDSSRYEYRLYYGVRWTNKTNLGLDLPAYKALKAHLHIQDHKVSDNFWTAQVYPGFRPVGEKFLMNMAQDQDGFVEGLATKTWQFFEDVVDLLDEINAIAYESD